MQQDRVRVGEVVRQRIADGTYPAGSRLPSGPAFQQELGLASYGPVYREYEVLEGQGQIEKRGTTRGPGAGFWVTAAPVPAELRDPGVPGRGLEDPRKYMQVAAVIAGRWDSPVTPLSASDTWAEFMPKASGPTLSNGSSGCARRPAPRSTT